MHIYMQIYLKYICIVDCRIYIKCRNIYINISFIIYFLLPFDLITHQSVSGKNQTKGKSNSLSGRRR